MITGFILGVVFTLVFVVAWCAKQADKHAKAGKFAYAKFDDKKQEWRVFGQYAGIAQQLADIRSGRKPGAIKYID